MHICNYIHIVLVKLVTKASNVLCVLVAACMLCVLLCIVCTVNCVLLCVLRLVHRPVYWVQKLEIMASQYHWLLGSMNSIGMKTSRKLQIRTRLLCLPTTGPILSFCAFPTAFSMIAVCRYILILKLGHA